RHRESVLFGRSHRSLIGNCHYLHLWILPQEQSYRRLPCDQDIDLSALQSTQHCGRRLGTLIPHIESKRSQEHASDLEGALRGSFSFEPDLQPLQYRRIHALDVVGFGFLENKHIRRNVIGPGGKLFPAAVGNVHHHITFLRVECSCEELWKSSIAA